MQHLSTKQIVASVHACICLQVPNSNDFGDPTKTLHHTTAEETFNQEYRCFQEVTVCQVRHAYQEKVPACTSEVSTVAAAALQQLQACRHHVKQCLPSPCMTLCSIAVVCLSRPHPITTKAHNTVFTLRRVAKPMMPFLRHIANQTKLHCSINLSSNQQS